VELPDMAEGECAQERPERRRRPDAGEQPVHPAVPQQRHVINRVSPRDHPRNQRRDLQVRVAATRPIDPHTLLDELLQTGPFGERQDRRETRARHQVRIVEDGCEAVAHSHLPDAPLCVEIVTVASHILLAQQGISALRLTEYLQLHGGSGLSIDATRRWATHIAEAFHRLRTALA